MLEAYAKKLRTRGYRMTPQRWAILQALCEADCHLTPLEIYQRAAARTLGLTEATVYRTLSFLCEQGLVMEAHIGNGQMVYEIADHAHHHLVCRVCGFQREIAHGELDQLYEYLHTTTGFKIDEVHVTLFGLCPACQA